MDSEEEKQKLEKLNTLVEHSAVQLAILKDRSLQERAHFLIILEKKESELRYVLKSALLSSCRDLWEHVIRVEKARTNLIYQKQFFKHAVVKGYDFFETPTIITCRKQNLSLLLQTTRLKSRGRKLFRVAILVVIAAHRLERTT